MRGVGLAMCLLALGQTAAAAPDVVRGKQLFGAHCAACHGQKGEGGRGARLTRLLRASSEESLRSIVRKGIPGTEMPPSILGDSEIADVAAFVRTLQRQPAPTRAPARGEQLYQKGGCSKCHTVGNEGGILGPDLSDIGLRRTPDYLRRALLDPEAEVPESFSEYRWYTVIPDNFLSVRVTTADGRKIQGVRLNEDPFSIQIRDLSDRVHSFWKSELKELHKDWGKSPMPSYKDVFTPAEIEELIAWLASLRGGR